MIDPRALRTFLAICREGTISGAARWLNISQPSVSVAIAQLEHRLGGRLFHRSRKGIELTAEGHALRRRAEAMESLLRGAEEEIALVREGVRGPLRVGGTPGALVSLLPDAIARLEERHTRFTLHVLERPDRELDGMLRKGDIELAFVTTGIEQPPPDMAERSFAEDPFALVVGEQHEHLPATLSLRDAAQLRWVLPEAQGAFRRQVDALFLAAGLLAPLEVIRCDSLLTTKAIVRRGTRVTILPLRVVAAETAMGTLRAIKLLDAGFQRQIGARWLRDTPMSGMAAELLAALESGS
ncbi:MAG: LysR family transcriptional regulator [Novosphingobium sp.]